MGALTEGFVDLVEAPYRGSTEGVGVYLGLGV